MKTGILLLGLFAVCTGLSTTTYFSPTDRNHAKQVLLDSIASKDIQSIHYSLLGLKLLNEAIPKSGDVCKLLLDAAQNPKATVETLYYAANGYKAIGNCPQPLPVINIVKSFNAAANADANIQDLYYAVSGLAALGQKPQDVAKLVRSVQAIIKKNDSLANLGYLFHITSYLGNEGAFAFDRIEDAIVQADEVDGKYLQYEGGLSITALLVNGAYKLSTSLNKPLPLTYDQAVKFANYFLSRKSVQIPKGVWSLLDALNTLTTNKAHLPVAVTLASSASVSNENPRISVKISDILGKPLGPLTVIADSATRVSDDVVVLSKKKFDSSGDNSVYTFNLMESKPEKGTYKVTISATLDKPDSRVGGSIGSIVNIKVMCTPGIDHVDVGTADADQTTQPKLERVQHPNKLAKVIEADTQQKILMRFNIKDKTAGKLISVHQAFVRFHNPGKSKSVTFVAEHDSSLQYKFDLDIGAKAEDFNHISGLYDVELIIGDAVLSNSFSWKLGSVKLSFTSEPKIKSNEDLYKPKPEIKHLFREPERRPAKFVSNLFSILVCLPLLLLLILWAKLRINVSNYPLTLSALGFHLGLGSIFALFGLFWLQFNMFQTMKYLLGVGVLTFLCGNKLLYNLAHSKK